VVVTQTGAQGVAVLMRSAQNPAWDGVYSACVLLFDHMLALALHQNL